MIVKDVMEALADQARTIETLEGRSFAYPPNKISPPTFLIELPETLDFDGTYSRGLDSLTIPALVIVGRSDDRNAVKNLLLYVDGAGDNSIKAALESGLYTAMDSVHVSQAELGVYTFAGVDYLGAEFTNKIVGSGA